MGLPLSDNWGFPHYCVRVTANDGGRGDQFLREFQDNEKIIPTVLTTSQKLSTGVDARNVRNIVLMRPVNSMIEFKQIIGRGTRLFDGKEFFTIIDFVDAYKLFSDPAWDGEPVDETAIKEGAVGKPDVVRDRGSRGYTVGAEIADDEEKPKKLLIKLRDGKEREIQHLVATSFWSADGKPVTLQELLNSMYGKLPEFFKDEAELRKIWSNPMTRKALLEKMGEAGYGREELETLQKMIDAENSDLFDVLNYFLYSIKPISRSERVAKTEGKIFNKLNDEQKTFLEFVLDKYVDNGVEELDEDKLPLLLNLKYHAIADAVHYLGDVDNIRKIFFDFQKNLYSIR